VVVALNGGTNALIFTTASSMFIESTSSDILASINILASNGVGASSVTMLSDLSSIYRVRIILKIRYIQVISKKFPANKFKFCAKTQIDTSADN